LSYGFSSFLQWQLLVYLYRKKQNHAVSALSILHASHTATHTVSALQMFWDVGSVCSPHPQQAMAVSAVAWFIVHASKVVSSVLCLLRRLRLVAPRLVAPSLVAPRLVAPSRGASTMSAGQCLKYLQTFLWSCTFFGRFGIFVFVSTACFIRHV
jgi:hypothetical protein